jgi:DNA primase
MPSIAQSKSLLEAAESYANAISDRTLGYLAGRGISETIAARYRLGTITNPINGHDTYEGWLSIPYITALGLCVGFKFRRLDDGKPKYGSPLGQKSHLYNVADLTLDVATMVICEGELDAVVLSGVCNIPAVAVPGVAAWKPHYSKLFTGYDTIYIVGDNDVKEDGTNPGAEFARRVASEVLNGQIVQLPPGMDINELYLAEGIESIHSLVGGA